MLLVASGRIFEDSIPIPQENNAIHGCADECFRIWRKSQCLHSLRMPIKRSDLSARRNIPQLNCPVAESINKYCAIRRKYQRFGVTRECVSTDAATPASVATYTVEPANTILLKSSTGKGMSPHNQKS